MSEDPFNEFDEYDEPTLLCIVGIVVAFLAAAVIAAYLSIDMYKRYG